METQNKVLAVDDNPVNIKIMEKLLANDYELKTATSGEEALQVLQEFIPDLILLDIMMPGMDGYEVCRQMRANRTLRYAKIIMVSAKGTTSERLQGYEAGADDYITKPFDEDELLVKVRVYLRLKSAEELKITVDKLTEANRELKDFVQIASHDLREPLRKISLFGRLLKDSLKNSLADDDKENLNFMIDGVDRMNGMVEGLQAYCQVITKAIAFEVVDLNEVVERLEQLELAVLLEDTGAVIEVPEYLPKVQAEPVQIRQLLQNLIVNGIKYHREGIQPRIVIKAKQIAEDTVRIEVEDNGIGIKEEYHQIIFTMFRRVHSRHEYEGTGIGLAICKKIVDRHNGQIGVESTHGEGSAFWFTLSMANEAVMVS